MRQPITWQLVGSTKMSHVSRLSAAFISVVTLVACSGDGGQDAELPAAALQPQVVFADDAGLIGDWADFGCVSYDYYEGGTERLISFDADTFELKLLKYYGWANEAADRCKTLAFEISKTGNFSLTAAAEEFDAMHDHPGLDTYNIDATTTSVSVTLLQDREVDQANQLSYCGINTWQKGVSVEVDACDDFFVWHHATGTTNVPTTSAPLPITIYDVILKNSQGNLWFGLPLTAWTTVYPAGASGTNQETRPTSYNHDTGFYNCNEQDSYICP